MTKGEIRYRTMPDMTVRHLTCVGYNNARVVLHDQFGEETTMAQISVELLMVSRIAAYRELEEKIRARLEEVHHILREHRIQFDPIRPFYVVVSPSRKSARQVHQYDKITGRYIQTFESLGLAARATGKPGVACSANIGTVCLGTIKKNKKNPVKTAYGFRWSYIKSNVICL